MFGFQRVEVIGNLGVDPEMKFLPDGTPITTFRMAVTPPSKKEDEKTTWYKVELWRKDAESANANLAKGTPAYVAGELDLEEWTDREGKQRLTPVIKRVTAWRNLGDRAEKRESADVAGADELAQSIPQSDMNF